jgi:peptidoglycan/LPS O-acetylase OafA/YrhL
MNRETSLYLDFVRPIAAILVLLSHLCLANLTGGQILFFNVLGGQAVVVFFVLSGFVIAHVTATRESDAKTYFISRAARIYSVAIPALILTWVADYFGHLGHTTVYANNFQAFTAESMFRSITFLGEQWNVHSFPGSNFPYWSLSYEVWYYVAFGVFMFTPQKWRLVAATAVFAFIGLPVAVMFPDWLMGVVAYHCCVKGRISQRMGWLMLTLPMFDLVTYEVASTPLFFLQTYLVSLLFAMHLIGFSTVATRLTGILRYAKPIRWFAGATFSIYLMHLPILTLIAAWSPFPPTSRWTVVLMLTITLPACFLLAEVSERRKEFWRGMVVDGLSTFVGRLPQIRKPSITTHAPRLRSSARQ